MKLKKIFFDVDVMSSASIINHHFLFGARKEM
jgi:hypothetical protein